MSSLLENKNWWNKNWKWIVPFLGIIIISTFTISTTDIGENTFDIVKAYADPDLVDGALFLAQENDEIKQLLGELKPIDKMAIVEGNVKYSNNDTSIDISVRVKGSKGKGRMRIFADRIRDKWEYKEIIIGIKKRNKTIIIVERIE